ncbi:hypothetical protein AB0M29_18730 [Streptomyces sp. NPDC051976]|uniref:hypothetical protein n=1 Tax=Streptomyces sp. NPDC051976 TaxID=3154947 RepID=UPI0034169D30
MSDNGESTSTFSRRGRTARKAAIAGAAVIAVAAGTASAAGATDARSHGRPAAAPAAVAQPGLGSAKLVQSEDFFQQGLAPVGATVDLTGKQALSACSGEETMRALTKGKAAAYADVSWTFDTAGTFLTESVADGATVASAVSYEKQLNRLVRDCQNEPAGHWHYGAGHSLTVQGGEATWYPSFNGDGAVSGGAVVIRAGHDFGILELTGQPTDDPGYIKGIAAAATKRLAG